jgi:hypothetical protein
VQQQAQLKFSLQIGNTDRMQKGFSHQTEQASNKLDQNDDGGDENDDDKDEVDGCVGGGSDGAQGISFNWKFTKIDNLEPTLSKV